LNESLRAKISNAQEKHVESCENLDCGVVEHKELTKDQLKAARLSPDS
jgi:hypothetical protein